MDSAKRFDGRTVVVTGAASGIGRATALRLAGEGASVAVVDINLAGAEDTVAEIGESSSPAAAYVCNVASSEDVARTVAAVEQDLGAIDVLANIAGTGDTATISGSLELDDERWQTVIGVNLSGPFYLCRAIVPGMARRGRGAVVNVSSLAGRSKSANGGVAYTSSKAGLLGLTRHLAFDYGPAGVRVNAICPGGVDTPMIRAGGVSAADSEDEAAARDQRIQAYSYFMPIKRLSTPQEQAAVIAFLASDDASYVNGIAMDVNGGLYMA